MTIKTKLASIGIAVSILFSAVTPTLAADKLVITLDTPPGHIRTRMFHEFVDMLKDRSGGSMTFEIFDSNQLYSSRDAMKAVVRGDAGMTILVTPYLSRVVADYNVFYLRS